MRNRQLVAVGVVALMLAGGAVVASRTRSGRMRHPYTGRSVDVPGPIGSATRLHSGWQVRPVGRQTPIPDMPLGGAVSPDGRLLALPSCGFNANGLNLVDLKTGAVVATVPLTRAWRGVAWAHDGRSVYVSGGVSNPTGDILKVVLGDDGKWKRSAAIKLTSRTPSGICLSTLALAPDGRRLIGLNVLDGASFVINTSDGTVQPAGRIARNPSAGVLAPDGKTLYVTDWAAGALLVVDVSTVPFSVSRTVATGLRPTDLVVAPDGRVYVACAGDDLVAVHSGADLAVAERVNTTLSLRHVTGSTPTALALSPDGDTLAAANSDNNNVCIIDVRTPGSSRVAGFVPTAWYPSAVCYAPSGKLAIASGKGLGSRPNPAKAPINPTTPAGFEYIPRQLQGLVTLVEAPNGTRLRGWTATARRCVPFRDRQVASADGRGCVAVPAKVGAPSPIKHVIYIIKENRTYDQVFGDMPKGNGDPSLCLFGADVTPNQHSLAEEYVLLDNTYCSGEVSQDGHPWSTQAIATEFTQRAWTIGYSGKGQLAGDGALADSRGGYLWEACKRKGLSFRSYGEYVGHPTLDGHISEAYIGKAGPGSAPPGRDPDRADVFIREFREFEAKGAVPSLMVLSLGENHTNGTRAGSFTPKAMVASNDQAVGRIVDAVSHSSVWGRTAIFIIEDDAQNGPDHVDAHRTAALVISPWVKRRSVDSTMYSTVSMLRTMELILGLAPLTQHDASAAPMYACFADKPDLAPFTCLPPLTDLNARNGAQAYGAQRSAAMDWSEYDRIDEDALNRILWHSIKGKGTPYPGSTRRSLAAE